MTYFAKPALAITFGAFMLCAETCLHAEAVLEAGATELPVYDWLAGAFLLGAGVLTQRQWTLPRRQYQIAAWAFMASLLTGALVSQLSEWLTAPVEPPYWGISETGYLIIIGALLTVAVFGLVSTIRATSSGVDIMRPL